MVPLEIPAMEMRQFGLLIKRIGADPLAFKLRKFAHPGSSLTTVHVHGRGAATVYEVTDGQSWIMQFSYDLARGLFGLKSCATGSAQTVRLLELAEARLAAGGLRSGLAFLNARVPHRFTAVYRLDGNVLRKVAVVDKKDDHGVHALQEVPLDDSFSQFVLKDGLFLTMESGADSRLQGHRYSGVVGSYAGVPILRGKREVYGTLCHFDLHSRELADEEFLFLERVAQILPRVLEI